MKRAFLVLGPASTGTRIVTRLLLASGCYGDGHHAQRLDDLGRPLTELKIVWRRSFPHYNEWPDVPSMARRLKDSEYDVTAVVTTRDWAAAAASQIAVGYVKTLDEAAASLREAYCKIFSGLAVARVPFITSSYESLAYDQGAARRLAQCLGLELGPHEPILDGNAKWFTDP